MSYPFHHFCECVAVKVVYCVNYNFEHVLCISWCVFETYLKYPLYLYPSALTKTSFLKKKKKSKTKKKTPYVYLRSFIKTSITTLLVFRPVHSNLHNHWNDISGKSNKISPLRMFIISQVIQRNFVTTTTFTRDEII